MIRLVVTLSLLMLLGSARAQPIVTARSAAADEKSAFTLVQPVDLEKVRPAHADGDYHIRSADPSGRFKSSHEILPNQEEGYLKAVYCDQVFWVRINTVLWTEQEARAGRRMVIENNALKGRKPVCANPEKYVTLDSLELNEREVERMRGEASPKTVRPNRLRTIREAFKDFK